MMAILVILLLFFPKSHAFTLPFLNSTTLPHFLNPDPPPPTSNPILNDALKAIAGKERWDPNAGVRVSELDPISVRVGRSQRYEFHVRVGKTVMMLKFLDGRVLWRKPGGDWDAFGSDFRFEDGFGEDPRPAIGGLELQGPLELRVDNGGDGDDELSLLLPSLNVTHQGLRRVLVGDGITIKVEGAQEVSLFHPHGFGLLLNRSSVKHNQDNNQFWPLVLPSCAPLLSVRVVGLASLVAFRTRNAEAYVETVFCSDDTVKLLAEKCYSNWHFKQVPFYSFGSLSPKLVLLEKILWKILGSGILTGVGSASLLKAKITSSSLVKFRLQVERDITENDRIWKNVAAWRTKPVMERIRFEIVARVETGKGLQKMVVRKLTRSILAVESSPWSNLMSNISFTQFRSIVVPPEALTLDVKW